eukprot:CAMPEP_0176203700 /NCGR_PEP_ID=MMETSP0121_2-20121125/10713_1 /TAXON_ID=160619 /ORGANISM="Kryptoperidinium foliaceum, Strain CCMP 1326" /LENGTH=103 /DNA_ID=CAMNT_0017542609 /DNA_START=229 /DNA_END=539 /DNA_ORIENTATION=-
MIIMIIMIIIFSGTLKGSWPCWCCYWNNCVGNKSGKGRTGHDAGGVEAIVFGDFDSNDPGEDNGDDKDDKGTKSGGDDDDGDDDDDDDDDDRKNRHIRGRAYY